MIHEIKKNEFPDIKIQSGVEIIDVVSDKIPRYGKHDFLSKNVESRLKWLENKTQKKYPHINGKLVNTEKWQGNIENLIGTVQVPIGLIGPINVEGDYAKGKFYIPLATTEGAITTTYHIGMRLLNDSGGVKTTVKDNGAHISPMFNVKSLLDFSFLKEWMMENFEYIKKEAESTTTHGTLVSIAYKYFDSKLVATFHYTTGDAQGLNMINVATDKACHYILEKTGYSFSSRSNYSGVKKMSDHNAIPNFGKEVYAEAFIPNSVLKKLKTSANLIEKTWNDGFSINNKSNIKGINCQTANAIAAVFLACGQDIADLSSSHVGYTSYKCTNKDELHIQVYIPSLTIGTVGGGTGQGSQKECLEIMDCYGTDKVKKFAELIGATVLAGELTTICAITTGTFVSAHAKLGRNYPE
jgi:hydroxymethylglutaryl-CoA reductase (NADPH)